MQRVSALLPSRDKRKSHTSTATKSSLERLFGASEKRRSAHLNRLSTAPSIVREDYWPATLDRECDRAARILKSFSTDGYLAPLHDDDEHHDHRTSSAPSEPQTPIQVFKRIPRKIIQNAAGIAIFTCMRSGLWMTGSGGSGILISRKADGTWSPPSGILLHTPTLSFIIGVDVYDCVLVVNNMTSLETLITRPSVTLGEDIGLTKGPLIPLDSTDESLQWRELDNSVLTYLKARGQSRNVNLHGCILTERGNENERFYQSSVTPAQIAAGNVSRRVDETRPLSEVIKMAEGRIDADMAVINKLATQPSPGDAMIATPRESPSSPVFSTFGVPSSDDPDPFGILALEMAGLEIREAGTRHRPCDRHFEYVPSPSSPAFSRFSRQSETNVTESNRASYMSGRTERTKMSDACTQTEKNQTPSTTPNLSHSEDGMDEQTESEKAGCKDSKEREQREERNQRGEVEEEVDYTKVDLTPLRHLSGSYSPRSVVVTDGTASADGHSRTDASIFDDAATKASSVYEKEDDDSRDSNGNDDDADDEDEDEEMDDDDEEPVILEVASVQPAARTAVVASPINVRGALVNIPKRIAPPLPTRSPARMSRASKSDLANDDHVPIATQTDLEPPPQKPSDEMTTDEPERIPVVSEPSSPGKAREAVAMSSEGKHSDKEAAKEEETTLTMEACPDASANPSHLTPVVFPPRDTSETLVPPERSARRHSKADFSANPTAETKSMSPRPVSVA
ncbi:LAS seventeen-binding protein [Sodiomyces alkalinus F11]|uniref:LAS seventeen-binding protein n=1 Tax=Sodiomyces alkalinus (strain CBS 110278 / VKM F-3762 / F11) TaxID=1314773 RepID=A0A3N2PW07_SODAK|nr:LAS seventeen-binding protein [Sodiomyces alkalinus F11]ROT38662.1 LAS seventeen-binding protein [Sodiomyces alkalinus F11]